MNLSESDLGLVYTIPNITRNVIIPVDTLAMANIAVGLLGSPMNSYTVYASNAISRIVTTIPMAAIVLCFMDYTSNIMTST